MKLHDLIERDLSAAKRAMDNAQAWFITLDVELGEFIKTWGFFGARELTTPDGFEYEDPPIVHNGVLMGSALVPPEVLRLLQDEFIAGRYQDNDYGPGQRYFLAQITHEGLEWRVSISADAVSPLQVPRA
jgi:hypothetical protein